MKKICLCVVFLSVLFSAFADNWVSAKFNEDLKRVEKCFKTAKISNEVSGARRLSNEFPCDKNDNARFQYVINSKDSLCIEKLMAIVNCWLIKENSGSRSNSEPQIDIDGTHLSTNLMVYNLGSVLRFGDRILINASKQICVEVKSNRVRITVTYLYYERTNSHYYDKVSVGSTYPYSGGIKWKKGQSEACVNLHKDAFATISRLIDYLNSGVYSSSINNEEEW